MLPVVWRASARDDLREIVAYIARENPIAARRMKDLLAAQGSTPYTAAR